MPTQFMDNSTLWVHNTYAVQQKAVARDSKDLETREGRCCLYESVFLLLLLFVRIYHFKDFSKSAGSSLLEPNSTTSHRSSFHHIEILPTRCLSVLDRHSKAHWPSGHQFFELYVLPCKFHYFIKC